MSDFIYNQPSILIGVGLFVSMIAAIEFAYRLGLFVRAKAGASGAGQINSIQASLLGLLALLLGFSFSLALQRFDHRSETVVVEADAIGTTFLRADLLPEPARTEARLALRRYLQLRIDAGRVSLNHNTDRAAAVSAAKRELELL